MPGKRKGSAKKAKLPAIFTLAEDLAPFGFSLNDIVTTPLGTKGTVIGVKYDNPGEKMGGRVWVRYTNGHEAPLEPRFYAGPLTDLGYIRCPEVDLIRRECDQQDQLVKKLDEKRVLVDTLFEFAVRGLAIPEELLPKAAKPKSAKPKSAKGKK